MFQFCRPLKRLIIGSRYEGNTGSRGRLDWRKHENFRCLGESELYSQKLQDM